MTNDYEVLKKYTSVELFNASIRKALEKKRVRVITGIVMIIGALFCVWKIHNESWHMLDDDWFEYSLTVLLFSAVILSGGVLISSVGSFKRWKFFIGASATAVLTCGVVTFLGVYTTLICSDGRELTYHFATVLRHTAPMLLIALCIALFIGHLFTGGKSKKRKPEFV